MGSGPRMLLVAAMAISCRRPPPPAPPPAPLPAPLGPRVVIDVPAPGRSPAEVEASVTAPIEHALLSVSTVEHVTSVSTADRATITAQLAPDADVWTARRAIVERLRDPGLPPGVWPSLLANVAEAPALIYVLSSERLALDELGALDERLVQPSLLRTPGVPQVVSCGGLRRELYVTVDPARLTSLGELLDALRGSPSNAPEDVARIVLAPGRTVADVATIGVGPAPADCVALDATGRAVLAGAVLRDPTASAKRLAAHVEKELQALALPAGVTLTVLDSGRRTTARAAPGATLEQTASLVRPLGARLALIRAGRVTLYGVPDANKRSTPGLELDSEVARALVIRGPDLDVLQRVAEASRARLGSAIVRSELVTTTRVTLDRRAMARLGVSVAEVRDAVALASGGLTLHGRLVVRLRPGLLVDAALRVLRVASSPLAALVRVEVVREPREIRHVDGQRAVVVEVHGAGVALDPASLDLPGGYTAEWRNGRDFSLDREAPSR